MRCYLYPPNPPGFDFLIPLEPTGRHPLNLKRRIQEMNFGQRNLLTLAMLLFTTNTAASEERPSTTFVPVELDCPGPGCPAFRPLVAFADPTAGTRTRCMKWVQPWPGAKMCVGHNYETMGRTIGLALIGPDIEEGDRNTLEAALRIASESVVAEELSSTYSEEKLYSANQKAETAFLNYLMGENRPDLAQIYGVGLQSRTHW